jgi:hypothetical protein
MGGKILSAGMNLVSLSVGAHVTSTFSTMSRFFASPPRYSQRR